jgi:hypothetical protein
MRALIPSKIIHKSSSFIPLILQINPSAAAALAFLVKSAA